MAESNYWIEHFVTYSSGRNSGVHQATKEYEIEVSDSTDFNPSIDVFVAKGDKSTFRQVYNLMLEFCHERDAYVQFKETLFAQVQALICNGKPIGGLIIDANKYFDKAKAEILERRKNIELRLVSVDEPPQKRRELRAEMKGIDFCISVLDANR